MNERELISHCDVCKKPIADHEGQLWVDRTAIKERDVAVRDFEAKKTTAGEKRPVVGFMTFYNEYPSAVPWQAHHAACDPEPNADAYDIDVERIRTWADLAHWTAQLMGHRWLTGTDWSSLLRSVSTGDGTRLRPIKPPKLNA